MFGGPKLGILFITSMAKPPLPRFRGDGELGGSLFAIYDSRLAAHILRGVNGAFVIPDNLLPSPA